MRVYFFLQKNESIFFLQKNESIFFLQKNESIFFLPICNFVLISNFNLLKLSYKFS